MKHRALKSRLKIAHYYPWVYLRSGIERVIMETARRSAHDHTVFTNHFDTGNTYPELSGMAVVRLSPVSVERKIWPVLKAACTIALQKIDLDGHDVLMVHCDGLGDLALLRKKPVPTVCYCHTPLRPVFDRHYRARARKRYPGIKSIPFLGFSLGFRLADRMLWRQYDHVLFNSRETMDRAMDGGLIDGTSERCEILHPGIDWNESVPTWRYDDYFLLPGRIMWTKNIEIALRAFISFKRREAAGSAFRLVVAGCVDKKSRPYLARLRELAGGRDDIEFVVSPSDEAMRALYADCYAVLFPAFNEDWGIVPLEANAYGKPVVALDQGGPAESQKDDETALLVSQDEEAFRAALARLAGDRTLTRRMGGAAREHAQSYDWSRFVTRIDALCAQLAE